MKLRRDNPNTMDLLGGPPDEEERSSLLSNLASAPLSLLSFIGGILNKPGRVVRGALGGHWDELGNIIPFSDTLGITDADREVTGRDLLENAGVLGANTTGLDWGDVAGFGAEVLTDPLTFIGGPVSSLTTAGKAGVKAGEIATRSIDDMARAINAGKSSLLSVGLPGVPFVSDFKPLISLGTGPKAAALYDAAKYNPVSNLAWSVFGQNSTGLPFGKFGQEGVLAGVKASRKAANKIADETAKVAAQQATGLASLLQGAREFAQEGQAVADKLGQSDLANRMNAVAREYLENTGARPSIDQIKTYLKAQRSGAGEAELNAMAVAVRGAIDGLAQASGKNPAEEFFGRFRNLQSGTLSDYYGVDWASSKARLDGVPVTSFKTPLDRQKFVTAHGAMDQTYRAVVDGDSVVPFITRRADDGKYMVFSSTDDLAPQVFDSLLEAQNKATETIFPDLNQRYVAQLHASLRPNASGAELHAPLVSLGILNMTGKKLLESFTGATGVSDVAGKAAKTLMHLLPENMQEDLIKALPVKDGAPLDDTHYKIVANWFTDYLNGAKNTAPPEAMAVMAKTLANTWESVRDVLPTALPKKVVAALDAKLNPETFLTAIDKSRGEWLATATAHSQYFDQMGTMLRDRLGELEQAGVNINEWTDPVANYFPRRLSDFNDMVRGRTPSNAASGWMQLHRADIFAEIPNMTAKINMLSLDPYISGAKHMKGTPGWAGAGSVADAVGYMRKRYPELPDKHIDGLADWLMDLSPKHVKENIPVFGRDVLVDMSDYMETSARLLSAAKAAPKLLAEFATKDGPGVTLGEAWSSLRMNPESLPNVLAELSKSGLSATAESKVPEHVVRELASHMGHTKQFTPPGPLVRAWDTLLKQYKVLMTAPWPAKHVRDTLSNMYTLLNGGALDPTLVPTTIKLLTKPFSDDVLRQSYDEMVANGTLRKFGSLTSNLADRSQQMLDPTRTALSSAFDSAREGVALIKDLPDAVKRGLNQPTLRQQMTGVMNEATPGIASLGTIATATGMASRVGQGAAEMSDSFARALGYLSLRKKGFSPGAAKERVVQLLHNFDELNDFEKTYMRRYVTFYSWMRKNLPLQVELLMERPGGMSAQTVRAINKAKEPGEEGYVPTHLRQQSAIPLGADAAGNADYLTGFPLPIQDLNNFIVPTGTADIMPAARRTMQNLVGNLNPVLTYPIEAMSGTQLWTGRPIKYLEGFTGNTPFDTALMHSPWSRIATSTRQAMDERRTMAEKLVNLASGFKTSKISEEDIPKWQMLDLLAVVQSIAKDNPHITEFERVSVRPDDIQYLSEDTQRLMATYLDASAKYRDAKLAEKKAKEKNRGALLAP